MRVVPTAFLFAALVAVTGAAAAGQHLRDSSHVESRFAPESVTFISTQTGWVLGTAPCASGRSCLALRETTDGGRDWSARVLPAALVATADRRIGGVAAEFYANGDANGRLNVRLADARDGWIYGGLAMPVGKARSGIIALEPALWSTHDGGVTWRKQSLPGFPNGSIFDLEAGAGTVHLLWQNGAGVVTVDSSPVTLDRWRDTSRAVALRNSVGGAEDSGAIVLQGTTGWVVEGNDRGTYGSARLAPDGRWLPWKPPCASVGGGYAVPAASSSLDLVAVCVMGGFANPLSSSAPHGATLGSAWLYVSHDRGARFTAGRELGRQGDSFGSVLASPAPAVILTGRSSGSSQKLIASFDDGAEWTVVYSGQFSYLGFTTATQGVGLVGASSASTTMIMTFDGGHHWTPVRF